ncbi:S-layer homology domain-containing protein [Paenibacillus sp. YYML68]|uniref:S-layer homology domain-containing protein n=1 Tax=Paenibacillus sp. YYML68 TaxID=2909250 RepID=UPI00248FA8EC|nr:S-layer homology domain-containing protein [Paenibacillus sp. YYML68]
MMTMNGKRTVRRLAAALLSVAFAFGTMQAGAPVAQAAFKDVGPSYAWASSSISLLAGKKILSGFPDGSFRPQQAVTKAEWSAMVYRLFDTYRPNAKASDMTRVIGYADVPETHWAYKPIMDLYDSSFRIGAYGADEEGQLAFMPDMPLTRLQLALMLHSYFGGKLLDERLTDNDVCAVSLSHFQDVPVSLQPDKDAYAFAQLDGRYDGNGWMDAAMTEVYPILMLGTGASDCTLGDDPLSNVQARALAGLQSNGIMSEDDEGYFRPLDPLSRAEAVVILDRVYHYLLVNDWLDFYSTVDLEAAAPQSGAPSQPGVPGTGASPSTPSTPVFDYNASPGSSYTPSTPSAPNSSNSAGVQVLDWFDGNGQIVKNLAMNGEIQTAIEPKGKKYITIDLSSRKAVDLYITIDSRMGFVRQEELPITLSVGSASIVAIRTQVREPILTPGAAYEATLTVKLTNEQPVTKKKR